MTSDTVRVERLGAVWTLQMHNPAQRNALQPETSRALAFALDEAAHDARCRIVVLHGAGGTFCSGGDLSAIARQQERPAAEQLERLTAINECIRALRRCSRPVIAAVEGHAAGAGASIALACDLIVAARTARFAIAHVRVGVSPDGGATLALARALPLQQAAEWMLTGAPVDAERLHAVGLVNRLCDEGEAVAQALNWAEDMATGPADAVARIKTLLNAAYWPTLDAQLERERESFVAAMMSDESKRRVRRFLDKSAK